MAAHALRTPRSRLLAGLLAALAGAAALALPGTVPPAHADAGEVSYPGTDGTFAITGHGYGHGHGMSQWGAYGAALRGLTSAQVLDFYYPGTVPGDVGPRTVRVLLKRDEGLDVVVLPGARSGALSVADRDGAAAPARSLDLPPAVGPDAVTAWRSVAAGGGATRLEGHWAGTWQGFPVGAPWTTTRSLEFSGTQGRVTLFYPGGGSTDYRGALRATPTATGVVPVDVVALEDYLRSVVPSESPASWPAAALEAQAVAARSYALSTSSPSGAYDVCDDTACQAYPGVASWSAAGAVVSAPETAATDGAVARTAGLVRTYGGAVAFTQFGASDGGWTVDGGRPYLVAREDPYDGVVPNSGHTWTARVTAAALGGATGTGTACSLRVELRDGRGEQGGRMLSATVTGTTGTRTLSGEALRSLLGLRTTWWAAAPGTPPPASRDLWAVLLSGTGTGGVELHGMPAATGWQAWGTHTGTAFGAAVAADWRFFVAPYGDDQQPDLYGVHLRGTGSGMVEVHVLSAASGYRTFLAHVATVQRAQPAGAGVDVALAGYAGDGRPDLQLVQWSGTGSGRVEVHVLDAASAWSSYLVHAATALPVVAPGTWSFLVGDAAGSGDLVGVLHAGPTGSGRTEVHVLSRTSGYRTFTAHVATQAALTDAATSSWSLADADGDGLPDVVLLLGGTTGSGTLEVHALGGRTGWASWTLHTGSAMRAAAPGPEQIVLG